jgi:hypothetical protein
MVAVAMPGPFSGAFHGTVYDLVREIPSGLLTLAQHGSKAYSEGFDLVHRREAPRSNAIWQADHAQLSILLLREDGQTARPWLTIVIDDYSRAIAGYYLGFDPPSSMRTALALRQGIWRKSHSHWHICGIPEVLYTDNGSDFTSKHIEQVAVDLKVRVVFSTPGKPQGRGRRKVCTSSKSCRRAASIAYDQLVGAGESDKAYSNATGLNCIEIRRGCLYCDKYSAESREI